MKGISKSCVDCKTGCQYAEDCAMAPQHSCVGVCQYYEHHQDGRDAPKRDLVSFIEALDAVGWVNREDLETDIEMVERVAFVFLTPRRLFAIWWHSVGYWAKCILKRVS